MNLTQLVNTVADRYAAMHPVDTNANLQDYQALCQGNQTVLMPVRDTAATEARALTPQALSQMLTRARIPHEYFHRCPDDLKAEQLNYWLQHLEKPNVVLREAFGHTVRAIVSERYGALDDINVLPLVADVLGDEEVRVSASFDTYGDFSHVRIWFPKISLEPRPGDVTQGGIHIGNSETGGRRLSLNALVYRLVCTNGMVVERSLDRVAVRHVSGFDRLRDDLARMVRDAKVRIPEVMRLFSETTRVPLTDDQVGTTLARMFDRHDLTQMQIERVTTEYHQVADRTVYGLINAITRQAQQESTFERRYTMERAAEQLLAV